MTKTHIVDNTERHAQPEPGEDEATQAPDVREEADVDRATIDRAKEEERERQTGE